MNFKEQLAHDNKVVFMNINEFAEIHDINGRKLPCIIDNNEMVDREKDININEVFTEMEFI